MQLKITHPFVHVRVEAKPEAQFDETIERYQSRFEAHVESLRPFATRNLRPEVEREFRAADRLGRGKPA